MRSWEMGEGSHIVLSPSSHAVPFRKIIGGASKTSKGVLGVSYTTGLLLSYELVVAGYEMSPSIKGGG